MAKPHETNAASSSSSSSSSDVTKPDSCYYPRCRKDANCTCEICIASINATLDLMPASVQKSSLTKLSAASRPKQSRNPVSFDASVLSSPTSGGASLIPEFPSVVSKEKCVAKDKNAAKRKEDHTFGDARGGQRIKIRFWRWILILGLVLAEEFGFSHIASRTITPELSRGVVRGIGEKSGVGGDVDGRVRSIATEIERLVHGRVLDCGDADSVWKIIQDGLILNSRCVLYKSTAEEVSLWGWPLQTAGLLTAASSSKSFTIIKGRVTQWLDGKIGYKVLEANDSWVQERWSSSAVQLDPGTLILEYRRSLIADNPSLVNAVADILQHLLKRVVGRIKRRVWYFPSAFGNSFVQRSMGLDSEVPT